MHTKMPGRRLLARTLTALLTGGAAVGLIAPATASASDIGGYSDPVQRSAVTALSNSEGIDRAAARHVLRSQDDSIATLERLTADLGEREVGGFLNARGEPVVNVLGQPAAERVRQAGATARVVPNSEAELDKARDALADAEVAHTTISTDPKTNKVVLTIADAAPDSAVTDLLAVAKRYDARVRVEQVDGAIRQAVYNGQAIYGGGTRCSAGFNVHAGGQNYIVDAGHCTNAVSQWDVGPSLHASFPGNDYGLIRNDTGHAPGAVDLYNGSAQAINSVDYAYVGQRVCKSGSTTGLTCGTVQATGVTVNYRVGPVHGLIQTTAYAQPGDSGGCLFAGSVGLGITSGIGGGSSYYQPVVEAMRAYGVALN